MTYILLFRPGIEIFKIVNLATRNHRNHDDDERCTSRDERTTKQSIFIFFTIRFCSDTNIGVV